MNNPAPMSFLDIYDDKKSTIEYAMQEAFNEIFSAIDRDNKYNLSTDEQTELIYQLMEHYVKK